MSIKFVPCFVSLPLVKDHLLYVHVTVHRNIGHRAGPINNNVFALNPLLAFKY